MILCRSQSLEVFKSNKNGSRNIGGTLPTSCMVPSVTLNATTFQRWYFCWTKPRPCLTSEHTALLVSCSHTCKVAKSPPSPSVPRHCTHAKAESGSSQSETPTGRLGATLEHSSSHQFQEAKTKQRTFLKGSAQKWGLRQGSVMKECERVSM